MNLEDVILRDTRANQPVATTVPAGTLYYVTDENVTERSNGAVWQDVSDSGGGGGITELTGNVTAGPGSGSQVATIANDAVTYAKIQNVSAASRLLGRGSAAGAGDVEEITLGAGVTMAGTVLNVAGSSEWTVEIAKTSDQDVSNNTVFQDDTELQFAVVAGESFLLELLARYSGDAATTDFKCQLINSGGGNAHQFFGFRCGMRSDELFDGAFFATTSGAVIPAGGAGFTWGTLAAHGERTFSYRGTITVNVTGTLKVQFANGTGGASAVSRMKEGSILRARLLG